MDPDGRDILEDLLKKVTPKNMAPPTMQMEGWEENKQAMDKYVGDAIKIAAVFAVAVAINEIASGEGGKTSHGEKRAKQAQAGDPHRQVGDPNRTTQEGRVFSDSETGNTIYTRGNKVIVKNKEGKQVSQFKTTRRNIQKRIKSGKWKPIDKK
jgi:hypothetical protein